MPLAHRRRSLHLSLLVGLPPLTVWQPKSQQNKNNSPTNELAIRVCKSQNKQNTWPALRTAEGDWHLLQKKKKKMIRALIRSSRTSLVAQTVKNTHTIWETWVRSLGWEDPLEKGMAIHSSRTAWRIPWTEEPGRLQSMGHKQVRHSWAIFTFYFVVCPQYLSRIGTSKLLVSASFIPAISNQCKFCSKNAWNQQTNFK